MRPSSTYLLRPTIWLPRADLDRLRAAEARQREGGGAADCLDAPARASRADVGLPSALQRAAVAV